MEAPIPDNYEQLDQLAKCEALDEAGLIYWSSKGKPRYKKYLSTMKGVVAGDIVVDIPPVHTHSRERIGYPTQKPLALLDRIIKASSNEGDIVFDPFCGCATALVSADSLNRQWVGIDLSPLAADLMKARLKREKGLFH
jgi:site-specific DNA-methyltransferase (adenine-specific)